MLLPMFSPRWEHSWVPRELHWPAIVSGHVGRWSIPKSGYRFGGGLHYTGFGYGYGCGYSGSGYGYNRGSSLSFAP